MSELPRRVRHLALAIGLAVASFLVLVLLSSGPSAHAAHASAEPITTAALTDTAAVHIEPLTSTVQSGETFTVSVVITDVVNLGGFQFDMAYDPRVVHAERAEVGPFLGSTGRTIFPFVEIKETEAVVTVGAGSLPNQPAPDGGGTLARIALTGQGVGHTSLDLQDMRILSPSGDSKPVTVADGTAVVKGKSYLYMPLLLRSGG